MDDLKVYGNLLAGTAVVRLVGEHEKDTIENEIDELKKYLSNVDWNMICIPIEEWFYEMVPWETAENVFSKTEGKKGSGATAKLKSIIDNLDAYEQKYPNNNRRYILAGYSLAGLFALWSSYQTDRFDGIVAASPSVWYPGWIEYIESNDCKAGKVYLSLGNKEHKTRNALMSKVGDNIKCQYEMLKAQGIDVSFEINEGNHFKDVTERMVKGICKLLTISKNSYHKCIEYSTYYI